MTGRDDTEPFVHLVDLTHTAALVAWGAFFFHRRGEGWQLVDDELLPAGDRRAHGSIGASAASYGPATVECLRDGAVVARVEVEDRNHAWIEGLEPDTEYTYRVLVDGEPWGGGERLDWVVTGVDSAAGDRRSHGRHYDLRFRTHPRAEDRSPVTFVAFGDYGVGIESTELGDHQRGVAATIEWLARNHPVRFLISLGDNIYHRPGADQKGTGDEDDDWFFTFYEPYRYLIDHLPLYPAAGNHDSGDTEPSDDRDQLADNFHLDSRFGPGVEAGRASLGPGLFYRLRVGALLELVCVDTSAGEREGTRHFDDPGHRPWLEEALPPSDHDEYDGDDVWRIPFCHHPPYCAGPHHTDSEAQIERLLPLYDRAGVRLVLCGHEHNFQHGEVGGLQYIVSGAGGKLDERTPGRMAEAGTVSWAAEPHCLLVEVDEERLTLTPYGLGGAGTDPRPLRRRTPEGEVTDRPIVITRPSAR